MLRLLCVLGVVLSVVGAPRSEVSRADVHAAVEVINANGYVAETHQVTTEDGYILTMQRIPYARDQTSGPANRPVVFMMHGLYGFSTHFIYMGPEHSIGYHLADAGFDVWFGNARGNVNSRAHVTLDPDTNARAFFDFSWEEIGMYDVAACIDFILDFTGQEKLHYIGHSQGGTVFLVLASMRPEYNEKMASVHLLAGVGYMEYFPNTALTVVATQTDTIFSLLNILGLFEISEAVYGIIGGGIGGLLPFPSGDEEVRKGDMCFGDIKYKEYCRLIGMEEFMRDEVGGIENAGLGGGSTKQIAHYGQNIRDKLFRRFHHGTASNLAIYGSTDPPIYDIGLITANVTMHYTVSDDLLDERDVHAMAADMPNTRVRRVARDSFLHADFVAAEDARELVTDYIIEDIQAVHDASVGGEVPPVDTTLPPEATTLPPVTTDAPDAASSLTLNVIFKVYLIICVIYSLL